jgi:hypothetical protein
MIRDFTEKDTKKKRLRRRKHGDVGLGHMAAVFNTANASRMAIYQTIGLMESCVLLGSNYVARKPLSLQSKP